MTPEYFPFFIQKSKKIVVRTDRFRGTEKEDAIIFQAVMEHWQQLLLKFRAEINEQITAGEQIQFGKGWILNNSSF